MQRPGVRSSPRPPSFHGDPHPGPRATDASACHYADPLGVDFVAGEWNRIAHRRALRLLLRLLHVSAILLSLAVVHMADLEDNGIGADGILPSQLRLIATGTEQTRH